MGFFLDIYVEYFFRAILRFFRGRGTEAWPIAKADVTSVSCRPGGFGCAVAEIRYKYDLEGEIYTGTNAVPFVMTSSAKEYVAQYALGSDLLVRVKPGAPESSIVRDSDQFSLAKGLQLDSSRTDS